MNKTPKQIAEERNKLELKISELLRSEDHLGPCNCYGCREVQIFKVVNFILRERSQAPDQRDEMLLKYREALKMLIEDVGDLERLKGSTAMRNAREVLDLLDGREG